MALLFDYMVKVMIIDHTNSDNDQSWELILVRNQYLVSCWIPPIFPG